MKRNLQVFVEGNTKKIWRSACNGPPCGQPTSFRDWERDVGAPPAGVGSGPAIASWGPDRLDVFVLGLADHAIWHQTWSGSRWLGWESRGGILASAPAAVSFSEGRLDLFATDANGNVWHMWCAALGVPGCRGSGFSAWELLPGRPPPGAVGPPAVASGGSGMFDLVVLGADHAVWHHSFQNAWGEWRSFGGEFVGTPAVAVRSNRAIDVYAVDRSGNLSRATAYRGTPQPWATVATSFPSDIAAVSDGTEIQIFGRLSDGSALVQQACDFDGRCREVRR